MSLFDCWHRWSKFSEPLQTIIADSDHGLGHFAVIQTRTCEKCGLLDYRTVRRGYKRLRSLKGAAEE